MGSLLQDIRYALRQLHKSPVFALTAVLTLAIGVGANTAVFTLVHGVMLKSLPVTKPGQLIRIGDKDNCCVWNGMQDDWGLVSADLYKYFRDNTPCLQQIAAMQSWGWVQFSVRTAETPGPAESFQGAWVSGNFFSTLGVNTFAGRALTPADDTPSAPPVAVISYRAWQHRFAGKSSALNSMITINGHPFTVVGIAPPAFYGDRIASDPAEFWIPLSTEPLIHGDRAILNDPNTLWLYLLGRAAPGANVKALEAQLNVELRQWLATHVQSDDDRTRIPRQKIRVGPGGSGITSLRDYFKQGLYLLSGASALVLLIACANLANLLLARVAMRRRQIAMQTALGASRIQLVRGMITESVLLSTMGGAAGLLFAYLGARAMILIVFRGATFVPIQTTPSLPILGFTFGIAVLTGVLFGVVPAWIVSRSNPIEILRSAGHSTDDRSALPQKSFVVAQAALSLVLLAAAGLVGQSLRNLQNVDLKFDPSNRYVAFFDPELAGYTPERLPPLYQELQRRLPELPGVRSAAFALYVPQGGNNWGSWVFVQGHPVDMSKATGASWERVSPNFFNAIDTPVLSGRPITEQDTASSVKVAVVNEAFVRKFMPNENPIGMHFGRSEPGHASDYEIVGVVADANFHNPASPTPAMFFLPYTQTVQWEDATNNNTERRSLFAHQIVLHVVGRPSNLEGAVRNMLASIDPNLALSRFRTYDEQVSRAFNEPRLLSDLTGVFSLLALALASVGLYGVTAYRVARRRGEIGIRMALGATPKNVLGMVLRSVFAQVGIGLVVGIPLAIAAGRLMASKLSGVHGYDPRILGGAAVVLGLAALLASVLPARTAATIEPMKALRTE